MADLTPQNALEMYRLNSEPGQTKQANMIREMDPKDAIELLAYMAQHTIALLQGLDAQIRGRDAVANHAMPEPAKRN